MAALWAMPWLVIFMGLLFKDDELVFHGGTIATGSCDDCCVVGGGCGACISSSPCTGCTVMPTQLTLTFSSVVACEDGPYDGVYVVTQDTGFGSPCQWYSAGYDHVTPAGIAVLSLGPSTLAVDARGPDGRPWFSAVISKAASGDCCTGITGPNELLSCAFGANLGHGGSLVISIC